MYDELSVYEVDRATQMLVPVFALGEYADEVMADSFSVGEGVTGSVGSFISAVFTSSSC